MNSRDNGMGSYGIPPRNSADDEDDFNPQFAQMNIAEYFPYYQYPAYPAHQRSSTSPGPYGPAYEYAYSPPMSPIGPPRWARGSFDDRYYPPPSEWPTPTQQFVPFQPPPEIPSEPVARRARASWSGTDQERRAYHPQAPAKRSDWVMWVGNVPPNTSHEELWRFFNSNAPPGPEPWKGPSSIFLISRSSCAFVNLSSQTDLDRAVAYFNGKPLRSWDVRCPRMVCRVRRKDDDLRSGVGAQRGTGMHREWVKGQHSDPIVPPEGEGRRRESIEGHNHSSNSFASTNSSFLIRHFPRRIFILKSATTAELEEAAQTSVWRTQRHNEPILDQAFRTATEVILVFGANKSGEFFGYAKMVEPIDKERAARRAALSAAASTPASAASAANANALGKGLVGGGATGVEAAAAAAGIASNSQALRSEPVLGHPPESERARAGTDPTRPKFKPTESVTPVQTASPGSITPASLNEPPPFFRSSSDPREDSVSSVQSIVSAPPSFPAETTSADRQALLGSSAQPAERGVDGVSRKDTVLTANERVQAGLVSKGKEKVDALEGLDGIGSPFKIAWLRVGSLPFTKTRNLRNPWNNDREVKISRDGTEVEPGIGAQLLAEWDKLGTPQRVARPPPIPHAPHYPLA